MDTNNSLVTQLEPLLPQAVGSLKEFFQNDNPQRSDRERARLALQVVNTAITLQRAVWTQQRHNTSIAKVLADGDLDRFEEYVRTTMPSFPMVRKMPVPSEASH